jgi:N-acetylmuramoyl-L-alanine amidase
MMLTVIDAPSPNFNERLHPLDALVLHYTGMETGAAALARLRDPASQVSAHYVVEEDGRVFALVPEERRAWHAGPSFWQGGDDLNSRSIGVEIVNGGHDFGLPPFPDIQTAAVIRLCQAILERWDIPASRIVGHSDIAPDRKEDPGERFPWRRLAEAGVGLWPREPVAASPDDLDWRAALRRIGYRLEAAFPPGEQEESRVLEAFQRRWRPEAITGLPDPDTRARIHAVAALV